jgi:Protein of unknown function (DUF1549)/Protein of unknown function (DUF1553)
MLSRSKIRAFAIFIVCAATMSLAIGDTAQAPYDFARWQNFWSFQAVLKPQIPSVSDRRWATNPIDQFIFSRLSREGLTPALEADRQTLIRRATFDLLGIPPTVPEIRAFVSDPSPDAYEKLIDRLLSSPHYGERWGRHWLDVARYVPGRIAFVGIPHTAGDQAYRDYVVRAFNADKPYNQFVTEQLAGDLLPPSSDRQQQFDQIIAPAFLSIGAWFDEETDPNRLKMEIIDDQIGTISQALLGLSMQCARCHDHKFDPIPTADYYALAGIFGSTKVIGQLNNYWRDGRTRLLRPLATPDEVAVSDQISGQIFQLKDVRWKLLADARTQFIDRWKPKEADYQAAAGRLPRSFSTTFKAENFDGEHNLRIAQLSKDGVGVNVLDTLTPVDQWVKYKIEVPEDGSYLIEAFYTSDEKTPLLVEMNGTAAATDALSTTTGGWDLKFERWETVARCDMRNGLNFLRMTAKQGSFPRLDRLRIRRDRPEDGQQLKDLATTKQLDPALLQQYTLDPQEPWPTTSGMAAYLASDQKQSLAAIDAQIAQLDASQKPHDLVISVADEKTCADMPVHIRGDTYAVLPQSVPRGVPRLLAGALASPKISGGESGRMELANWITDRRNPLTARVLVNRLWQWHFGRGIVASSSDFGSRGEVPSHPELLDWLAASFVEHGWSVKQLHKMIMLSATYRMAGTPPTETADRAARIDPDNRLLSSFRRQRLDAEELYDAMLCSANLLLPQKDGEPLDVEKSKNRAMYVLASNRAPKGLGPEIRKMFPLFDDDPAGASIAVRPTSTTPAQGLFWLNSPVASYYAGRFAERLLKMDKLDDAKRVEMAYLIALGHAPGADALNASLNYVQQQITVGVSRQDAWGELCQAIFASDEFHYVA